MIRVNRTVTLLRKHNASVYENNNAKAFAVTSVNLTSSVGAVNSMLASATELAVLMPGVIGLSPNNEEWQSKVTDYFHSISIPVSRIGTKFNISYNFNIDLNRVGFKDVINKYIKDNNIELESIDSKTNDIKDRVAFEKEILSYINGDKGSSFAVSEYDLYQYVIFENIEDYIKYRYCLVSSRVANDVTLINKSNRIDFYIATEETTVKEQEAKFKQNQEALQSYMKIIGGSNADLDNYLISFDLISSHEDIANLSISQKGRLLQELAINDSAGFLDKLRIPNHEKRAFITKLIWFNVLTRIPGSGTIVDSSDTSIIVGNDINEAVSYISNQVHKGVVSIWESKLKSILQ